MRYYALATDYDGTIASRGRVAPHVIAALERLRASGRQAILITGRRLEDLLQVFPRLNVFDSVIAENGAVLYWPETRAIDQLAPAPSPAFLDAIRARGVTPLAVGSVIVATTHPNEHPVLDIIRDLALELQIVFNGHE